MASRPTAPTSRMPSVKPPWRLAQSDHQRQEPEGRAAAASAARTRPATQATITGSASTCGRAELRRASRKATAAKTTTAMRRRAAPGGSGQGGEGEGDAAAARRAMPVQPASERRRRRDLRQPLLGDPGRAGEGEGERVGVGQGACSAIQLADDEMPVAVGVVEEVAADEQHDEVERRRRPAKAAGRHEARLGA